MKAAKAIPTLSEKDKTRFFAKVKQMPGDDGCWIWTASKKKFGYGQFNVGGRVVSAHRVAFHIFGGLLSDEFSFVIHGPCNDPACVNPKHLSAGNNQDNLGRDKLRDGTTSSGDKNPSRAFPDSVPRGEAHHASKLTVDDVVQIRLRYASGGISQQKLSDEFNVPQPAISRIIHGKRWKHVA